MYSSTNVDIVVPVVDIQGYQLYFFVDTHGIENASEPPKNGVYAPLNCGNDVMAFARDPESSRQVWNSTEGYPGDYDYREYYSDIGFELELDYIAPYILDGHTPGCVLRLHFYLTMVKNHALQHK
jgi:predicted glycosyl hydrolase (DUF1957 family)